MVQTMRGNPRGRRAQVEELEVRQLLSLTWPAGQLLPRFATPQAPLGCMDLSGYSNEAKDLFTSLQGIVNREQPRLITADNFGEGKFTWINAQGLSYSLINPWTALTKYRSLVSGLVVDDPSQPDTLNLATTIAGLKHELIVDPSLLPTLQAAPYNLPIVDDLRGRFTSAQQVYQYEHDNYWAQCQHRILIGLDPVHVHGALRDFAVATQSAVIWLDPAVSSQAALAGHFFADMSPVHGLYMGWWPQENPGVSFAGHNYGIPTFATDYFINATVYGGIDVAVHPRPLPALPALQNKIYVSFVLSDGDNAQYMQHQMRSLWNDPARGSVPMGWTVSPLVSTLDPPMLNYYYATASADDCLLSGPSGAGYTYASDWTAANQDAYTKLTDSYLQASGLRIITPWNSVTTALGDSYAANDPSLLGITSQDSTQGTAVYANTLPRIAFATTYGSTEASLESGIASASQGWNGAGPLFVTVQGSAWNLSPTNLKNVAATLDPTRYAVVRPDQMFMLYRESHGLPIDPPAGLPAAPTALAAAALSGSQVRLAWTDNANNEDGYAVEESADGGATWATIARVLGGSQSFVATQLPAGTPLEFRVRAYNAHGVSGYSNVVAAVTRGAAPALSFPGGFAGSTAQLQLNGSAALKGATLELTDGNGGEAASVFSRSAVPVQRFSTTFDFRLTSAVADGMTFTIQLAGPTQLGGGGGSLGYGGIPASVAVKFDVWNNNGEGIDSTGLFTGGASPTGAAGSFDMTASGLNLHTGDTMEATLVYDGSTLLEVLTDTVVGATFVQSYPVNLSSVLGATTAYVGFTAATGGSAAVQDVLSWSFTPLPTAAPASPANLRATPASGSAINLSWSEVGPQSWDSFLVLRRTGSAGGFVQIAWLAHGAASFADTGLTPGTQYSYEVIATNGVGNSAPAGAAGAVTPIIGDLNFDGAVNFADLLILAQNYGRGPAATWAQGDLNGDGTVDFADLLLLAQNYR